MKLVIDPFCGTGGFIVGSPPCQLFSFQLKQNRQTQEQVWSRCHFDGRKRARQAQYDNQEGQAACLT